MNRSVLLGFINRYNVVESKTGVKWTFDEKQCRVGFTSDNKDLYGEVICKDFPFIKTQIGIFDTDTLVRLLKIAGDSVDVSLHTANGRTVALGFEDGVNKFNFPLANLAAVGKGMDQANLPDPEITFDLDNTTASTITGAYSALKEPRFTVNSDFPDKVRITIGGTEVHEASVSVDVETTTYQSLLSMSFKADYLKNIIDANKGDGTVSCGVLSHGLFIYTYEDEDFKATYWLPRASQMD